MTLGNARLLNENPTAAHIARLCLYIVGELNASPRLAAALIKHP